VHKTSVYALVNGNVEELAHWNNKNHKRWYCPHHTD